MYAWSFNKYGFYYNGEFDTFEEALVDARRAAREAKERVGKDYSVAYIGRIERYMPDLSVFDIIERISDDCYDHTCCETYITDLTEDEATSLLTALRNAFLEWARGNGQKPDKIWSVKEDTIERVVLSCEK